MARKKQTTTKIVNPAASDSSLTKSEMPFSSVPLTTANAEPVRPLTVPASRQIVAGGAVRIVKGKGI